MACLKKIFKFRIKLAIKLIYLFKYFNYLIKQILFKINDII
jgi:hypothetical protein